MGIWVGVKSLWKKWSSNFRPDVRVPQIYEAYCLCIFFIKYCKPLQAKQRDLGSVWPITARGQILEPEAQAGREKVCGQERM